MITIKITRDVRESLKKYKKGNESVDMTINRLLDDVEQDMDSNDYLIGNTNININEDTMKRIKSLKIYEHESYDRILYRALSFVDE